MLRVDQRPDAAHHQPVQQEEGISLRKPVVLILSIIASIVAYKNFSEKNRKPIAAIILGSGVSYSVGLCNMLSKVASLFERDEEERPLLPRRNPLPGHPSSPFSSTSHLTAGPWFQPFDPLTDIPPSQPSSMPAGAPPRVKSGYTAGPQLIDRERRYQHFDLSGNPVDASGLEMKGPPYQPGPYTAPFQEDFHQGNRPFQKLPGDSDPSSSSTGFYTDRPVQKEYQR